MTCINPSDKLILALDGMTFSEMLAFISDIPDLTWVKVGLELFTANGPEALEELRNRGKRIFLDLKFHDIPNTMAGACYRAAKCGAELITVHACAGERALLEANQAAKKGAAEVDLPSPILLGVTVLTSWSQKTLLNDLDINQTVNQRVEHLAGLSYRAGLGGCVCSPWEVQNLRSIYSEPFELVAPGIRFSDNELNDQSRVMTPLEALNKGASKLVLGRIVTKSISPADTFERICKELKNN